MLGIAFAMFIVILAQSAATSRAYATRYGEDFSEDVDLVGLSIANLGAGLSGTFVVNGSPTKTQMVDGAGGRSQVAQLTTGAIVLIVLLFLTAPIQYMPKAVLASVVFLIGIELVDLSGMRKVLRLRSDEFVVAALVAATVVLVGVEQGIVLAIVASVIDHMRRSYRPTTGVMQPPTTGVVWHAAAAEPDARSLPGLVVYRFAGSIYYANSNLFFEQASAFAESADPPRWLCLDVAVVPDIDYSGGETIRQLHGELHDHGIKLVIAEPLDAVAKVLDRYGLTELLGLDAIYPTVGDAVAAFRSQPTPNDGS